MIKIKSFILDETNWIEVTWVNENDEQIHCESFSGHPEHIKMLRDKAKEFGTNLKEFEGLIKEAEDAYTPPTQDELDAIAKEQKIAEAKAYLASTDFKMTVDYYATLTLEAQDELTAKRAEARAFLKENGL